MQYEGRGIKMYDMHCHLDLMPNMQMVAEQALKRDINILTMTTTPKAYKKEIAILKNYTNIRVALGLHPQLIKERYAEVELVEQYIEKANYIGEIGLDFGKQYYSSKQKQIDVFDKIIKWSSELGNKVISIHSVKADRFVVDMIEKSGCYKNNICILHWFSGTSKQLQRAIEMGCYFSVNYKMLDSDNGRKLLSKIPPNRIVLEPDAPFILNVKNSELLGRCLNNTIESLIEGNYGVTLDGVNKLSANIFTRNSYS